MIKSNLILNNYERKFIASSNLFWGYTQIYDIRLYDNIGDIIILGDSQSDSILSGMIERVSNTKFRLIHMS